MKIETFKDLEIIIKLCRKQGVSSIKVDNVELQLGDAPEKQEKLKPGDNTNPEATSGLTEEELMLWSVAN